MTRITKLATLTFAVLLLVSAASAQSPYPSLAFAREPNTEGSTDYVLRPMIEEIQKRVGGSDKPYQIVGAVARPSKQLAVLLFVNGQKEIQFRPDTDTNVVITIDSLNIKDLTYQIAASNESESIKLQIANVLITLKDLQRIAKGKDVAVKFGPVVYHLDSDNLNAFRFLSAEIEKDLNKAP